MLESLESDVGAKFDGAGRIDDDIHLLGPAQQQRILGCRRSPGIKFSIEARLSTDQARVIEARVAQNLQGSLGLAVRHRHDAHAGRAVRNLVRKSLTHEARADNGDTDGISLLFSRPERGVDKQHV